MQESIQYEIQKFENNVQRKIFDFSKELGELYSNGFYEVIFKELKNFNIISPIEQILYSAFRFYYHLIPGSIFSEMKINNKKYKIGLQFCPQFKVGSYKVDFLVKYYKVSIKSIKEVIVECDSQQFHERNEEERRKEKERERFLVLKGYKIFRFTGKEIIQNTKKVCDEIYEFLTSEQ
jgi:very-short-patch-repair endonuclease